MSTVEHVKRCVIGNGAMFPDDNYHGDMNAACRWDCYRRATMLEPMAEAIFRDNIPGDFLEAGVFKGGIAIAMAATMLAGDGPAGSRTMWLADSFDGLPNVSTPVSTEVDSDCDQGESPRALGAGPLQWLASQGDDAPPPVPARPRRQAAARPATRAAVARLLRGQFARPR